MQVELSMTMIPAEPSIVPFAASESKSRFDVALVRARAPAPTSRRGCTALSGRSSCSIPPPSS